MRSQKSLFWLVKQYIIKEENINYINCNNPTEAEMICLTIKTLMGIYVQQFGFIDYLTHSSGSNAIDLFYTSKRSHSLGSVNLELSLPPKNSHVFSVHLFSAVFNMYFKCIWKHQKHISKLPFGFYANWKAVEKSGQACDHLSSEILQFYHISRPYYYHLNN